MKQSILLATIVAIFCAVQIDLVYAGIPNLTSPSASLVCLEPTPDIPALPQENDFLCGDVTGDGLVNVLDIISLVSYIMGGSPNPFNMDAADITADDNINVLDIIAMVNIIMQVPGQPCGCVAPVTYEGQTYTTVQIGNQCWFRENLNVGTMIISDQGGQLQTDNDIIEKYCYDNISTNCDTYGGLYEWNEVMQYDTVEGAQGICPAGWHIPSDNEWKVLEGTVDSQYPVGDPEWDGVNDRGLDAGGNLKETGITHWYDPNIGATNSSGFTGLPGGDRNQYYGSFVYLGYFGYFWSSSQLDQDTDHVWSRDLYYTSTYVGRNDSEKTDVFSVRCLKGCWPEPIQANAGTDQLNIPGLSTTLAGNTPTYGTGLWAIVSGTGGTIVTPSSPTSEFQGVAGNEYTLAWTITTQCGNSADQVLISFATAGFTCGDELEYEEQSYATVQIGDQCWMAENLNVGTKINSTTGGYQQTNNGIIEKYCFNNNEANCDVYGGLYEWPEAMQYVTKAEAQGVCPEGWHIPAESEWMVLIDHLEGTEIAGGKMKSIGTIEEGTGLWHDPNLGATNESGFTGIPGGYREIIGGYFYYLGYESDFWSSSQYNPDNAWCCLLNYDDTNVPAGSTLKNYGLTIRCLKDD